MNSSPQPTVARTQKTPATMAPFANREMRLIKPALPLLGMPMNLSRLATSAISARNTTAAQRSDAHVGAECNMEGHE